MMSLTIPKSDVSVVLKFLKENKIKHYPFTKLADGYSITVEKDEVVSYLILKYT
jgi:hypothetical protein